MDKVLKSVLVSELPSEIKQKVLRNCLVCLKNESDMKNALDVCVVCLHFLHSLEDFNQLCRYELECICQQVVSGLSDSDLDILLQKLRMASESDTSSFSLHSLGNAIDYACSIYEARKLTCLLKQLESLNIDLMDGIISVLRIFSKIRLVFPFVTLTEIRQELSVLWSSIRLIDCLQSEQYDVLTTGLLLFLAQLGCYDGSKDPFIFDLISDISYRASEALLHIMSIKTYNENTDDSVCDGRKLTTFLNTLVGRFLLSPVSQETCYLPLASFLFCLDSTASPPDENGAMLSSFVESVINNHVRNAEECVAIIKRLIAWLMWPSTEIYQSPMDKWIIGFVCYSSGQIHSANGLSFSFPVSWLHFIMERLRFVLGLLCEKPPSVALLNTLAFLLLAGNPTLGDPRYSLVKNDLLPTLCTILEKFKGRILDTNEEFVLRRLSNILQLLEVSLYSSCSSSVPPVSDIFDRSFRPIFVQMKTLVSTSVLKNPTECLAVYSWPVLLRWGSKAGINLRRCWAKWDKTSHGFSTDHMIARMSETSDEHRANGYRGLVNIGNTCYANAALQLLYHCPDFRLALLGSDLTSPPVLSASDSLLEGTTTHSTQSSSGADAPSCSTCVYRGTTATRKDVGLLHSQLFFLFQALSTHHGSAVHDLGAVLTLSKPAHFVNGEQQDASEYLNHLLERLHEEELGLMNSHDFSEDEFRSLPAGLSQSPGRNIDASTIDCSTTFDDADCLPNDSNCSETHCDASANYVGSVNRKSFSNSADPVGRTSDGELSLVRRLFGGQLVHHTSCTECAHVSSTRYEHFSLLYLPVASAEEMPLESEQKQQNPGLTMEQDVRTSGTDLDLTSLIRTHFTQIEYVPTQEQCESCGKETKRARRLSLRHLASHVFICLNVFTYCRTKQSSLKISRKIAIPERLSVTFSEHATTPTDPKVSAMPLPDDEKPQAVTSRSYALHGMILHHGMSISCGHYTCVTRVGMQWIWFDDDTARYTTLEQVYSKPMTTPYLLLYIQV